jgi:hypothetical protein
MVCFYIRNNFIRLNFGSCCQNVELDALPFSGASPPFHLFVDGETIHSAVALRPAANIVSQDSRQKKKIFARAAKAPSSQTHILFTGKIVAL